MLPRGYGRQKRIPLPSWVIPTLQGVEMAYLVARGTEPVVIREMSSLEAALEYAGQLISDNYANVAIHDGKGNQISGDDLIACYLGVMRLTPDLRAADARQNSGRC